MINAIVVDTDVFSFLFNSDTCAEIFCPYLTGVTPVVSFMTVAELDRWALERKWGEQR